MPKKGKYIDYYDISNTYITFFTQKQEALRNAIKKLSNDKVVKKINSMLPQADVAYKNVSNQQLEAILSKDVHSSNNPMSGDLNNVEVLSQQLIEAITDTTVTANQALSNYDEIFGQYEALVNSVAKSSKGIYIQNTSLQQMLNRIRVGGQHVRDGFIDIKNMLGTLGEIHGAILAICVAQEAVDNILVNQVNKDNLKITVVNSGASRTMLNHTVTSDNVLIIESDNKIVFQLNLSDKMNTGYQAPINTNESVTKAALKLRQTTIGALVGKHSNWAKPLYNIISYHKNKESGNPGRIDFWTNNSSIVRSSLGFQLAFDALCGTQEDFMATNGMALKDYVHVINYGGHIRAVPNIASQIYNSTRQTQASINPKIESMRSEWLPHGLSERSILSSTLEAEKYIEKLVISYKKTFELT